MATLNINIIQPKINYISNIIEQGNSCVTIFQFDIEAINETDLTFLIERMTPHATDYDSITLDTGTGFEEIPSEEFIKTMIDGKMQIKIGNVQGDHLCNAVRITITDPLTNNSQSHVFKRCIKKQRC